MGGDCDLRGGRGSPRRRCSWGNILQTRRPRARIHMGHRPHEIRWASMGRGRLEPARGLSHKRRGTGGSGVPKVRVSVTSIGDVRCNDCLAFTRTYPQRPFYATRTGLSSFFQRRILRRHHISSLHGMAWLSTNWRHIPGYSLPKRTTGTMIWVCKPPS